MMPIERMRPEDFDAVFRLLARSFPAGERRDNATFLVVGEGVTCINLHDIVDQAHQHDLCDIYGFIGILTEKVGHDFYAVNS